METVYIETHHFRHVLRLQAKVLLAGAPGKDQPERRTVLARTLRRLIWPHCSWD